MTSVPLGTILLNKHLLSEPAVFTIIDKFCYLGDMLSVDGDADAAVETIVRIRWNKFRQLVPLLTNKNVASAGPYANLHLDPDTTTPASHHSVFHRPDALPAAQPTASKP